MSYRSDSSGGQQTRNININPRDFGKLGLGANGLGTTRAGATGLLGPAAPAGPPQRSIMTPAFNPRLTTADLINQNTESPNAVQPQVVPGENPIQKILQQLQELMIQGPNGPSTQPMQLPTFDPNRFKKQAETAVNSEFDPIIQQLMAQQGQTKTRAGQNRAALGSMYGQAVQDINAGAAQTQKGYDQSEASSKQLYTDERNRIAASYAADAAAQRAQAKKLGIESLGGGTEDAIAAQNADKNFADQLNSQQMQSSQAAYGQQEQGAAQYDKSIAQATQAEGIGAQGDIMKQLEDYLSQSNSDIAQTRSQAAGSVTDLMQQLANSAFQRDSQNAQFQYQQQRDQIGDSNNLYDRQRQALMDQLQLAQNSQGQGASTDKLNPYQEAATFADQLQPGQGQDIIAGIQAAMNGRPEIYARANNDPVAQNPALFAKLIADYPGNENLDRNTLMMVSQLLYNQLYGK